MLLSRGIHKSDTRKNVFIFYLIFLTFLFFNPQASNAQYFGRNKPRYQSFDFKVHKSEHFLLYNYLDNASYRNQFLTWAEEWYLVHQAVLGDTLSERNPILLYNNHPEFQQTNAVSSVIGVGTGGVTDAFKRRVIMPLALTRQQTHHVLGHELVHVFQYHMILSKDSMSLRNLSNLPLWMVEGMAEYLSIGRYDPNTAMWMRDAVVNDDIPTLEDLSSGRYFPYRYGQAFWAFISGFYGDSYIKPFFMETARSGLEYALNSVLGLTKEKFSDLWAETLRSYYTPLIKGKKTNLEGKELITEKTGGYTNVSPAISPDGKLVAFWSDRKVLTFDLFIADAQSGEIIQSVTKSLSRDHFDFMNFMESGGTWSPDSRKLAYVVVEKGRHVIIVENARSGETIEKYKPKKTTAIYSPAWSPDGDFIVYAGMVDGKTNLYKLNVKTGNVFRLTHDEYAHIQPSWSLDGKYLVFSTDYLSRTKYHPIHGKWQFNLAVMDMKTGEIKQLDLLPWANVFNPVFTKGNEIWFISDHKGYRNLYSYNLNTGKLHQRTDAAVGVSGITAFSPALSYSSGTDRIVYNSYFNKKYTILSGKRTEFPTYPVNPQERNNTAGTLPPINTYVENVVNKNIALLNRYELQVKSYPRTEFQPRFKLDHISGSAGAGVGIGSYGTGTALAGGVSALFSDITGDHQIYVSAGLNGEIYDAGIAAQYLNRRHRIQWGIGISHIPTRLGATKIVRDREFNVSGQTLRGDIVRTDIVRIFHDQVGLYAQYPLSRNYRFEIGGGATYQYFRADRYEQFYSYRYGYIGSNRYRIGLEESIYGQYAFNNGFLFNVSAGFIGDNSYMGPTGPIAGWRFRLSSNKYFGLYDYYSVNVDLRRYIFWKPVTLALRFFHFGRLGQDANAFYPFYIGQLGLVRGLNFSGKEFYEDFNINVNQLLGSKILLSSVELRIPFTGIKRLSLIPFRWVYSDLFLFGDAGTTFSEFNVLYDESNPRDLTIVTTAGVGIRVNLFGLVLTPYYAWFFHNKIKGGWGFSLFIPGW